MTQYFHFACHVMTMNSFLINKTNYLPIYRDVYKQLFVEAIHD